MLKRPIEVHFGSETFGSNTCCNGDQLVALLEAIEALRPALRWFAADVEGTGPLPIPRGDHTPILIGDAAALIQLARQIDQFEDGVFVGVPPTIEQPRFGAAGPRADENEVVDLGDATIELVAFDWSFWSVSAEPDLIDGVRERLRARYGTSECD